MNVNQKGAVGLSKVIADLTAKGIHVFTPFDDYCPVDLIALNTDGSTVRIQVKYRALNSRGYYEFSARSIVNGKAKPIDRSLIDYWAAYLADDDKIVYLPVDKLAGSSYCIKQSQIGELGEWLMPTVC